MCSGNSDSVQWGWCQCVVWVVTVCSGGGDSVCVCIVGVVTGDGDSVKWGW